MKRSGLSGRGALVRFLALLCTGVLVLTSCGLIGGSTGADPEEARVTMIDDLREMRSATNDYLRLYANLHVFESAPGGTVGDMIDEMEDLAPMVLAPLADIEASTDHFMTVARNFEADGGDIADLGLSWSDLERWKASVDLWVMLQREQTDPSNFCFGDNLPQGARGWSMEQLITYEPFVACLLEFTQGELVTSATAAGLDVQRYTNLIAEALNA